MGGVLSARDGIGIAPGFAFVVSGNTLLRARPAPTVGQDLQMTTAAMIPINPKRTAYITVSQLSKNNLSNIHKRGHGSLRPACFARNSASPPRPPYPVRPSPTSGHGSNTEKVVSYLRRVDWIKITVIVCVPKPERQPNDAGTKSHNYDSCFISDALQYGSRPRHIRSPRCPNRNWR